MGQVRGKLFSVVSLMVLTAAVYAQDTPAWKAQKVDLGLQNEARPWSFSLLDWVQNPEGVRFEAQGLPAWMQLDEKSGRLSGTPSRNDVGDYDGIVFTAISPAGRSAANASGTVLRSVRLPRWKAPEIVLEPARENYGYSTSVLDKIDNPDGLRLEFELVSSSAPRWLSVGETTGAVFGTPGSGARGETTARITFQTQVEGRPLSASVTVRIPVVATNRPPHWAANPLTLPGALSALHYEQDLSQSVRDPDGEALRFAISSGPDWATIDQESGVLSGTPSHTQTGPAEWVITATDPGGLSTAARVRTTVAKTNEAPLWEAATIALPDAQQGRPYQVDLSRYARDPDGDPLRFIGMQVPNWLTVGAAGSLVGTPGRADVGAVRAQVRVEDSKGGHSTALLTFFVQPVNDSPYWILDPIQMKVPEGTQLRMDLTAYARDNDGDALLFGTVQTAGWGQLSPQGVFSGTPGPQHVGKNVFQFRVADKDGAAATARVWVEVLPVHKAPVWTSVPALPAATEGRVYQSSVAQFVTSSQEARVVFEKVGTTPTWVKVAENGLVSGTPWRRDVGKNKVTVRAMDQNGQFSDSSFELDVESTNQAPRWRQSPLYLGDAVQGLDFNFALHLYAADEDGDTLRFEKISGPDWLLVDANGRVYGKPGQASLGAFDAVLRVRDGSAFADTQARGTVLRANQPPRSLADWPVIQVKERETLDAKLNDLKYVLDPDGDALEFALKQSVDWVKLTAEGTLTLSPSRMHRGNHSFAVAVDDGKKAITMALQITVLPNPRPPVWHLNPIRRLAMANIAFSASLKDHVQDLDGLALSFFKKTGKAWLTTAGDGSVKGTPLDADRGENTFEVSVCNTDKLCADAVLVVEVGSGLASDRVRLGDPSPGAKTNLVWVLDPSAASRTTVDSIQRQLPSMRKGLSDAGVDAHHTTLWSNAGDSVPSGVQSPLWTLYQHFALMDAGKLPRQGFVDGTPLETVVVTRYRDALAWFTDQRSGHRGTPASAYWKWLGDSFLKANKSWRVSTITPRCQNILTAPGESSRSLPESAYAEWTQQTSGMEFDNGCDLLPAQWLKTLGDQVVLWARAHSKQKIKLSQTPIDPTRIDVSIGGRSLDTNNGPRAWSYDAPTRSVQINWSLVDKRSLSASDWLEVKYASREQVR